MFMVEGERTFGSRADALDYLAARGLPEAVAWTITDAQALNTTERV